MKTECQFKLEAWGGVGGGGSVVAHLPLNFTTITIFANLAVT